MRRSVVLANDSRALRITLPPSTTGERPPGSRPRRARQGPALAPRGRDSRLTREVKDDRAYLWTRTATAFGWAHANWDNAGAGI